VADVRDEKRDVEDQRARIAALVRVPIHLEPKIEFLRIANLTRRAKTADNLR
jgi:hypothetical protein